ncbi:TonB-dependent receptor [Magnetovirga frankeli]|nr:TonB-dependent receptor [gamma proteobacterium SS-5]
MEKTMHLQRSLSLALLSGISFTAQAEPLADEILVTASKTETPPAAVRQLDTEDLRPLMSATNDSASLLRDVPGMSLYGSGGVSSLPVIHGLGDDRLRTKINGMDIISACGNHMNSPLSYIDPSNVGKVTVFSNLAPVSSGGDSIGGTIIVESAAPEFAEAGGILRKGSAGVSYRSNGDVLSGNLSATLASDRFSLNYQGATVESENYTAGGNFKPAGVTYANDVGDPILDADEVGSSRYKATNQAITLGVRNDNHLFQLKVGVQDIPYQGWPNQRMDMTGNESEQFILSYNGDYNWGKLEAKAYKEHTRHWMQFDRDKLYWYGSNSPAAVPYYPQGVPCPTIPGAPGTNGCAAGMPMDTEADNLGFSLKADVNLNERDLLRIGAEAQNYTLDEWWNASGKGMAPNTYINFNNGERDRRALFGEWEASWSPQWLTQLGLRYERVNMDTGPVQGYSPTYEGVDASLFNAADRAREDDNIDLTAMARFTPDDTRSIEFGYSRKTRSPNLYERYAWSTHGMSMRMINWAGDANGYVGNLNLEPEVAHSLSATFNLHDPDQTRWGLSITPYYTYVDDYIDAARCDRGGAAPNNACTAANMSGSDKYVYLEFVNQSAILKGLDISGHATLAEGTALGTITLNGLLNVVDGENDTTGDNLYNIMPLNAKLSLNQELGNWNSSLELVLVDSKDDVSATRNEMQTDGYALVNLRGSYQYKQARFDFGVENLFDRNYDHPLGGAYMGEGQTMAGTAVPWGTPVPGMGRSVYAGVQVDF